MSLPIRALAIWLLLLVTAIVNGTLRQALLIPWMGEQAGHVVSTGLLSVGILALGWVFSGWLGVASPGEAWVVGGIWFGMTLGFEFIGGHYIFHAPWTKLLADYNLAGGRVWLLVPVVTLLTPRIVYQLHR